MVGLHGGHCCSHRLELMRQIYNMNESACPEDEEPPQLLVLAPPPAVLAQQQQQDILQCISACAQQTRLSLANLLPSRFVLPRWYAAARNKLVGLVLEPFSYTRMYFTRIRSARVPYPEHHGSFETYIRIRYFSWFRHGEYHLPTRGKDNLRHKYNYNFWSDTIYTIYLGTVNAGWLELPHYQAAMNIPICGTTEWLLCFCHH